ncbi:hypothetical protein BP6252_02763 [Coleophoma cylindrospora]|uniref:Heterokaryon incompatibility domain-containing protein n=1 Tax=Coleophoma cylindrospora TaxID=1849047 RepID=A0A3D8SFX3_9HELO|nr:hypothetical protein BP6252_02763 [Coleophoma cylindrospora]
MLCKLCAGISISHLVDLAKTEFSGHGFPSQSYYQHHASYDELISSAAEGCELCKLIDEGLKKLKLGMGYGEGWTREELIRDEGKGSDIKLCITAIHVYVDGTLDQVEVFDTMMVQVGAIEPVSTEQSDEEDEFTIPPLKLALSVPREHPLHIKGHRVGRFQLDPDLGSQLNHDIARSWLDDCLKLHSSCSAHVQSVLPTRVIDVGSHDGALNPRLVLSNGAEGRYAALSHCWGGPITPTLTLESHETFQDNIPLLDLPANFRDAICITRQLGIPYIWIDSLCIIQNSVTDWETESAKMGLVYQNAVVTISADASRGSTVGILNDASKVKEHTSGAYIRIFDENSDDMIHVSFVEEVEEDLRGLFLESPLSQRGWTLQERILSRRTLHYGQEQIYWQCKQGCQSADGFPPGTRTPEDQLYPRISDLLHPASGKERTEIPKQTDVEAILDEYYELVTQYSSRVLTYGSDKFPAFGGLAGLLHPIIGGEYIAGIWTRDFWRGILWQPGSNLCNHVEVPYRAPSWSWAVTDDPVDFAIAYGSGVETSFDAELVSYAAQSKSGNMYGNIESARLVLKGLTKPLVRSTQVINNTNIENSIADVYFDEREEVRREGRSQVFLVNGEGGSCLLATIDGERGDKEWDIDFDLFSDQEYIAMYIKSRSGGDDDAPYMDGCCLVLEKSMVDSTYRRVGMLVLSRMLAPNFEEWMMTWESETITII